MASHDCMHSCSFESPFYVSFSLFIFHFRDQPFFIKIIHALIGTQFDNLAMLQFIWKQNFSMMIDEPNQSGSQPRHWSKTFLWFWELLVKLKAYKQFKYLMTHLFTQN